MVAEQVAHAVVEQVGAGRGEQQEVEGGGPLALEPRDRLAGRLARQLVQQGGERGREAGSGGQRPVEGPALDADLPRRRHAAVARDQHPGERREGGALGRGHAATASSCRRARSRSAERRARAAMVAAGFTEEPVTKTLPSTTHRFGTS